MAFHKTTQSNTIALYFEGGFCTHYSFVGERSQSTKSLVPAKGVF